MRCRRSAGGGCNPPTPTTAAPANILATPLRNGTLTEADLDAVQRRRTLPTRLTQGLQVAIQQRILDPVIGSDKAVTAPWLLRLFNRLPWLARIPARLVGVG